MMKCKKKLHPEGYKIIFHVFSFYMKDYSKYKCADFASDRSFIKWVKDVKDTETDAFWKSLIASGRVSVTEAQDARIIVQSMRFVEKELPEHKVEALWRSIMLHTRKKYAISHYWRIAVACAASVALVFGLWRWWANDLGKQHDNDALVEFAVKHASELTAGNDVQIVLSDNTNYTVDGSNVDIEYDDSGQLTVNEHEVVDRAAQTAKGFNQVIVPWGKRTTISFADGTKLWLNAGSRAVYPIEFAQNRREVFIEGEGYFEVAKDDNKPFIVKTGVIEIKVLGTDFNVSAYPQEEKTEVALASGSVQVTGLNRQITQLRPHHVVEINNITHQQAVKQVDIYDYTCWKDGFLQLRSENIEVVLRRVERYYAVPIIIETQLNGYTISGKLDLKDSMTGTLNTIVKLAPVQYQVENNKVFIHKK